MNTPLVSVVMGVYQPSADALRAAVRSIICQTYENWEFIIVDDGSPDKSWHDEIASLDSRITLLKLPVNSGLSATLNRGLNEAKGEFIARQDADDISQPERLASQVAFLSENCDISFCGTNILYFDETGIWGSMDYPIFPGPEDFLFVSPFCHGSVMFRTEALSAGYRTDKAAWRCEDYELFMRLYASGMRGANLSQPHYLFREDSSSEKRRTMKERLRQVPVRYHGFKSLGLLPKGLVYAVKPVAAGLLPKRLLSLLKDIYYSRRDRSK